MQNIKILVTGATGFIGKTLSRALLKSGFNLRVVVRQRDLELPIDYEVAQIDDIGPQTDWQQALAGVDVVVHLAARVHIVGDTAIDTAEAFRKVNVLGTERLARMAVKAGVKRFIFISSVKVNGEGFEVASAPEAPRNDGRVYAEKDVPAPQDAYGVSKMEAEQVLASVVAETGLKAVVLRLPLVYGPGVKANFKNLIKITSTVLPLPFKGVNNRRSFIYLGNLVDAINACITHPKAAGETFMVSDGQDISTPDLIRMIASAMNKKTVLFLLHPGILKALSKILGKTEELEKLTGSLLINSSKIRNLLGWKPPFTMEEGIKETVKCYK